MLIWLIKYEDIKGITQTYMNIGFPSNLSAQREIDSIKRAQKKFKIDHPYYDCDKTSNAGFHTPSFADGKNWRIIKKEISKLKQ